MEADKAFKILMENTRFFQSFPECERLEILKCCTSLSVNDGKLIFQEGTNGDDFFILINGSVRIIKSGKTVDVLRAGECFGEMGALSGQVRSATAEASGDLVLLVINQTKVEELNPETRATLYKNILMIISDRLRERLEKAAR